MSVILFGGFHVTITHDELEQTIQGLPPPPAANPGPHCADTHPPPRHIQTWSL